MATQLGEKAVGRDDVLNGAVILCRARRVQPDGEPRKGVVTVEARAVSRINRLKHRAGVVEEPQVYGEIPGLAGDRPGEGRDQLVFRWPHGAARIIFREEIEGANMVEP